MKGSMVVLLLALMAGQTYAQYYSPREYETQEARYIAAGIVHTDFRPRASNTSPDSLVIRFSGIMPTIGFHQGIVDITFGYQRYTLRQVTRSTVFLSTSVSSDLPLIHGTEHALAVPLMISADYTKADAVGAERDNFNVASVGLGIGLRYRFRTGGLECSLHGAEVIQYAVEGFSTGTGFSSTSLGEASVFLRDIGILEGIALGYRARYQTWSLKNDRLNYAMFFHGPYVGVIF